MAIDSFGKRDPLLSPDEKSGLHVNRTRDQEERITELKALLSEATVEIHKKIQNPVEKKPDPESYNLILRAFDYVKYKLLPELDDTELAEIFTHKVAAESFVLRKVIDRIVDTVVSAEGFLNVQAGYPSWFEGISMNEQYEMIKKIEERTGSQLKPLRGL